jgi:hypothetical protein
LERSIFSLWCIFGTYGEPVTGLRDTCADRIDNPNSNSNTYWCDAVTNADRRNTFADTRRNANATTNGYAHANAASNGNTFADAGSNRYAGANANSSADGNAVAERNLRADFSIGAATRHGQ